MLLLKDLGLGGLWIAKVTHLVKQLKDDDKIVPDALFLNLFEVFTHNLDKLVEEGEDHGSIGIVPWNTDNVQVLVLDVHESAAWSLYKRSKISFLLPLHK